MTSESQRQIPRNSLFAPMAMLKEHGIPINTIIDIGCADGTFGLECMNLYGRDIGVFNIDAQPIYEPSLRRIQQNVGGHYKITAVSSFDGQIRFGADDKDLPGGDRGLYGARISDQGELIDCRTIDSLLREYQVPEPYFFKMDIEGAEFSVLQGAVDTLDKTVGMTLEVDVFYGPASRGNFLDIYSFLAARNFSLLDITNLGYRPSDHVLYQVHASFLNKKYEFRHAANFFSDGGQEGRMGEEMRQRRDAILARNEHLLRYL